jgi:hypothetical protein
MVTDVVATGVQPLCNGGLPQCNASRPVGAVLQSS